MTMSFTSQTHTRFAALSALLITLLHLQSAIAQNAAIERLENYDSSQLFSVTNGALSEATVNDGKVLRWSINAGQTSQLSLNKEQPLLRRLRYYDRLQFEFRIVGGEINGLDLNILGHVSGPRSYKVHNWNLAVFTTDKNLWQCRTIDLARPNWFPWDDPDGKGTEPFFRFESLALAPGTVIELRNLRLYASPLFLKPDYELPVTWPVKSVNDDGSITYTSNYQVLNTGGRPAAISAKVVSSHSKFKVSIAPPQNQVKNGATATYTLTATLNKADIDATPELYAEPLQIEFAADNAPESPVLWQGHLVRPLTPGYNRQVIAPEADIQFLREKIAAGDTAAKDATGIARILARSDQFVATRLDAIPAGFNHPSNNIPQVPGTKRAWQPGEFMPEIVDKETGRREAGTSEAYKFWKEYLGYGGVTENLGLAYLLTGDEKYASKAVELFELYGKQYRDLGWSAAFNPPWNNGPTILASSRTGGTSTYGSNWYFKWHCKLLSMISGSQAWQKADRKLIYEGFVLPYATEIIKFPGGIGNMTDITNGNLLLLGLVFDDAHLVRHALLSDPGLIRRLNDLTPDGFSSEGRPLNYHFAAMDEYVPALTYLVQSGLKLDYQKDKLLGALRMPYLRATLWGGVPLTGDMGRGWQPRATPLADHLLAIFPQEEWLVDIGQGSTLAAKARSLRTGRKPDADAWRKLVSPQSLLFADAGLAILRSGDKPENQIQVSLDYGRNVYHAALDRNQITLAAFGKMFTQGTGSIYNAGSGGVTLNPDKKLQSFVSQGSLGQNVVLVDGKNQLPAVGKLIKWNTKGDTQYAVSHVAGIAPGVTHTRGIVLTKGVVVLLDRLESDQEHTYDWVYHNLGELKLGTGWSSTPIDTPLGNTANFDNVVEPSRLSGTGPLQLIWDLTRQTSTPADATKPASAVGLSLNQLPVSGGEAYTGYTGMNNPNTAILADKTATLFQRVKGKRVEIVTILEPYTNRSKVRSVVGAKNGGVTVDMEGTAPFTLSLDQLTR